MRFQGDSKCCMASLAAASLALIVTTALLLDTGRGGPGAGFGGGGVKEACKEAQFDWGRPAQHGIIKMSRSGAFDVVQVATHVCSQGGVRHVRIMGGGILCLKALPDLPQQGKRETVDKATNSAAVKGQSER